MQVIATVIVSSVCVSVSLCVCQLDTLVSPAKAVEPIEVSFGIWTCVGPKNHLLDGEQIPGEWVILFGWERWCGLVLPLLFPLAVNYRPILLLNIFDKLLEKVHDLLDILDCLTCMLIKYQFDFRRHYSTTLGLIDVIDKIYHNMDEGKIVYSYLTRFTKSLCYSKSWYSII